jgi:hypothetical protein
LADGINIRTHKIVIRLSSENPFSINYYPSIKLICQ